MQCQDAPPSIPLAGRASSLNFGGGEAKMSEQRPATAQVFEDYAEIKKILEKANRQVEEEEPDAVARVDAEGNRL